MSFDPAGYAALGLLELPLCGHLWPVPAAGALAGAVVALCVEVVLRVDVVLGADPLVDASATPALPAPIPAAITAVRTNRLIRRGRPWFIVPMQAVLSS